MVMVDIEADLMIKDLYSADMLFYARSAAKCPRDKAAKMRGLWQASVDIVAAIKSDQTPAQNLVRYTRSPNAAIRREYNRFRVRIRRAPARPGGAAVPKTRFTVVLLSLDAIRVEIADSYRVSHKVVDSLITMAPSLQQMATSLMK